MFVLCAVFTFYYVLFYIPKHSLKFITGTGLKLKSRTGRVVRRVHTWVSLAGGFNKTISLC